MTRLRVERIGLTVDAPDFRPALVLADVREVTVKNLAVTAPAGDAPVAWLRSAQDCLLDDIFVPRRPRRSPDSAAPRRRGLRVLAGANPAQPAVIDPDVDSKALRTSGSVTASKRASRGMTDVAQQPRIQVG